MVHLFVCLEFAGHNTHKGNAVPVCLVHVCLNLKDKGGKILVKAINHFIPCLSGQWGSGHVEKCLQKWLNAEVGQGRTKKHRGQLAVAHRIQIKVTGSPVQQYNLIHQLLVAALPHQLG